MRLSCILQDEGDFRKNDCNQMPVLISPFHYVVGRSIDQRPLAHVIASLFSTVINCTLWKTLRRNMPIWNQCVEVRCAVRRMDLSTSLAIFEFRSNAEAEAMLGATLAKVTFATARPFYSKTRAFYSYAKIHNLCTSGGSVAYTTLIAHSMTTA